MLVCGVVYWLLVCSHNDHDTTNVKVKESQRVDNNVHSICSCFIIIYSFSFLLVGRLISADWLERGEGWNMLCRTAIARVVAHSRAGRA